MPFPLCCHRCWLTHMVGCPLQPLDELSQPAQEKLDLLSFLVTFPSLWEEEGATCSLLPGNYLLLVWGMPKAWLQAVGAQRRSWKSSLQQLPAGRDQTSSHLEVGMPGPALSFLAFPASRSAHSTLRW